MIITDVLDFQYMSPALPPKKSAKPRLERGKNVKGTKIYETSHVSMKGYDDVDTEYHHRSHYKGHHYQQGQRHHGQLSTKQCQPRIIVHHPHYLAHLQHHHHQPAIADHHQHHKQSHVHQVAY